MTKRMLNVVLDLNRVLCFCEPIEEPIGRRIPFNELPHSSKIPARVGPKLVYVCPNCAKFLRELSEIAFISVWSSMKKFTVDEVSAYLFWGKTCPRWSLAKIHA